MATFTTKSVVDELMATGHDEDDFGRPITIVRVVEYETLEGQTVWGVVYLGEDAERYNRPSPWVYSPRTIWEAES